MCRFKSGIILKSKVVVAPGANDSHSDLLEEMGIEDTRWNAERVFVRAELVPEDNEWWVNPKEQPDRWTFIVDQDIVPKWFDKAEHEKIFREYVCDWWDKHVLVDKKIDELSSGFYKLKRCEVKKLCNDVLVLLDSSQVGEMFDSSQVGKMWGSSQVGEMWDSSQVGEMWGSSQVGEMLDSSQVGEMWDSSQVGEMWGSSQVGEMWDSSTARNFKNYPKIQIMVPDTGNFEMVAFKEVSEE
ncbi:hypothetical protein [Lacrimispora sp.]|uniref:hypothetical protein n=1 Tax=Lacrimispora sp. TaxID=2719234 RepID=UPI00289F7B7E|nr:hypothetical protein [Lacrimispora sp.]